MEEAIISWYIIENNGEELPTKDFYAGSFDKGQSMRIKVNVWNNRWGTEEVRRANDCILYISFGTLEDSVFLKHIKVKENGQNKEINIINSTASVILNSNLSGEKHNLDETKNRGNFIELEISLDILQGMTESIKNIILDLDYNSKGNDY